MAPDPNGPLVQIVSNAYDLDVKVALNGYNQFKKELKLADPELRKAMDREIRGFLKPIASRAKGLVPGTVMRNWKKPMRSRADSRWGERAWDQSTVQKGIVVRQGGQRAFGSQYSSAWSLQNRSAAGAIYETAGKRSGGHGVSGIAFVSAIMAAGGRPSRLIYRAWDDAGGEKKISTEVVKIIEKYEQIFAARTSSSSAKD